MTKRHPVKVLLCPATIYQHAARFGAGYAPSENARFAVVRDGEGKDAPWAFVHRRTGARVGSLLPVRARKLTMTDMLAVASAFEAATHLDWSPFDSLPVTTPATTGTPKFANERAAQLLAGELRTIAAGAVQ